MTEHPPLLLWFAQAAPAVEPVHALGWWAVGSMLALVGVVLVVSRLYRLRLERDACVATLRAVVQLVAVGLVIGWVFEQRTWFAVTGLLLVMTLVAGISGAGRTRLRLRGLSALFSVVLGAVTAVTLTYVAVGVLRLDSWEPRYLIPLGGMILGNTMTAGTLAVERLVADLKARTADVEALLALGASPTQATRPMQQAAVRAAMTPILNTMMIVGIVTLPGMMTGQMLGGSAPLQAALYQLLILIVIAFCNIVAAVAMTRRLHRRFFTPGWQLDRAALRRVRVDG